MNHHGFVRRFKKKMPKSRSRVGYVVRAVITVGRGKHCALPSIWGLASSGCYMHPGSLSVLPERLRHGSPGHSSLFELKTDGSVQFWHLSKSSSSSQLLSKNISKLFVLFCIWFLNHVQQLLTFTVLNTFQIWNMLHYWLLLGLKVMVFGVSDIGLCYLMFCYGYIEPGGV